MTIDKTQEPIERPLLHKFLDERLDFLEKFGGHGSFEIVVQKGQTVMVNFAESAKRWQLLARDER